MNTNRRFPLIPTLLCLGLVLALPVWGADAPAGKCGAAPVCQAASEAPPVAVAPVAPEEVPFTNQSPAPPDFAVGRMFASFVGDCCPSGGASLCPCVNGYLRHCGSPQCETGAQSCLYLPCSTCHC